MDRAESLAMFAEVAERGSFAEAARRRGRSPAAVTRDIAELERRLGVRLLNRTTRAVSLTEAGQRLLSGAKRVLADLDEIERAAAGAGTAPRGELRVTAPILFGRLHVEPLVLEFLDRFPDVSVALMLIDRSVDLVEEGLDVAVRIGAMAEEQAHHPDLQLAWGKVVVEIWTHKIDGLTESDFVFAAKCDRLFAA